MAERSYDKNIASIQLPQIPDDVWIAGVVVVTMNEDSEFAATFIPDALDATPIPEVQEILGAHVAQAWALANSTGLRA